MNIYQRYLKKKPSSPQEENLFGILRQLENENFLKEEWHKKSPKEKNSSLEKLMERFSVPTENNKI